MVYFILSFFTLCSSKTGLTVNVGYFLCNNSACTNQHVFYQSIFPEIHTGFINHIYKNYPCTGFNTYKFLNILKKQIMKKTCIPFESEIAVSITNGAERGKNKLPVTSNTAVDRTPGKHYRSRNKLL